MEEEDIQGGEVLEDKLESENHKLYQELLAQHGEDHLKTLFEYCFKTNFPYVDSIAKTLVKNLEPDWPIQMPEVYENRIKGDSTYSGLTFFGQIKQQNFDVIYSEDLSVLALTEEDKKNRMSVMEILSYDPFKDDEPENKPQLYRDMAAMLTESMRKDVTKAKAALQIVRNYANIEKYQKRMNELMKSGEMDEETQKQVDSLIKIQKTLQDSINQTADKNNFTVKGLGNGGRGMLSDVMNQVFEKGIDSGVTNFYDIETSKSIEEIANISMKAQLTQINLSKTDYADILTNQAIIVKDAQKKAKAALEGLRIAKEKIAKQELLAELENEYRKKGISEREIQDFISQEYNLYDVADE